MRHAPGEGAARVAILSLVCHEKTVCQRKVQKDVALLRQLVRLI